MMKLGDMKVLNERIPRCLQRGRVVLFFLMMFQVTLVLRSKDQDLGVRYCLQDYRVFRRRIQD